MPDDSLQDLDATLSGIDVDSTLADVQAGATPADTITLLNFVFCILNSGRSWKTLQVSAPSPELAAATMDQLVQKLNEVLVQMGYPPNLLTWSSGACS